jgi:hypothetical protein
MTTPTTERKICLLLTGNIAPVGVPHLERTEVSQRENDYVEALTKWLSLGYPLVFCENSGYNSTKINALFAGHPHLEKLQFVSSVSTQGKGHGEAEIIAYAFKNSQILQQSDGWIVKVTGRYFVENAVKIIKEVSNDPSVLIVANMENSLRYADSRFFMFRRIFYEKYLSIYMPEIDEMKGVYFEHTLAKSTLKCLSDGFNWRFTQYPPLYVGVYGTKNIPYKNDILRVCKRYVLHQLRRWAIEYKSH